jgi:hypothetical protein
MIIELAVVAVAALGYVQARGWVRRRLRFVDAAQHPFAPIAIGTIAALAAGPVVWILPWVGVGTALLFGTGVGLGAAHGARDVRRLSSG